ncbi:hypothetical protein T484DRAFT_1930783 [Baffinella frigidus]|nr:hypothetical protein T484DRAFT_1930783 [Cryptophyta sp. CCMP2293]
MLAKQVTTMLSGGAGGFGYDTCVAWGEPGNRFEGCDEFFPAPVPYKDLRAGISKTCSPTKVQFVTEPEQGSYPFGYPDQYM